MKQDGLFEQNLDFDRDLKPFVEDQIQEYLNKIKQLQNEYNSSEQEIANVNLHIRNLEQMKRQLKARSTAQVNHEYRSKETQDLMDEAEQLEDKIV